MAGGVVVEVGVCSPDGYTHSWGEKVLPYKVTAHDLDKRMRLKNKEGQWFRYDMEGATDSIYEYVASEVLKHLYEADEYWKYNGQIY